VAPLRDPSRITKKKGQATALNQSALLELLEALRLADVDNRIRTATETLYQALIEAELTATLVGGARSRTGHRGAAHPRN
jgi:putative transposase